jgi:hypothetical protein
VDGCAGQTYDLATIPEYTPDSHGCSAIGEGVLGRFVGGPPLIVH